jgi:hypothetical protein
MKSSRTGEPMVPVLYCDIDGTIRWGKDELGRFVNGPEGCLRLRRCPRVALALQACRLAHHRRLQSGRDRLGSSVHGQTA